MKKGGLVVLILVLSLGTWYCFYIEGMTLTTAETGLITGLWMLVVLSGKWLWTHMHKDAKGKLK